MNRSARAVLALGAAVVLIAFGFFAGAPADDRDEADVETIEGAYGVPPGTQPGVDEAVTVAVTPCRLVDTREADAGPLLGNVTRGFLARGNSGFAAQGGKQNGCAIPEGASAAVLSISVVDPSADGFLRAWPAGQSEPQATLVNFQAGDSTSVTSPVPLGTGLNDFLLRSNRGTHVVVDVVGYSVPQIHVALSATGAINQSSGSIRATNASLTATGKYTVFFDRFLSGCTAQASVQSDAVAATASARVSGSTVLVRAWRANDGTVLALTNQPVNVTVDC